MGGVPSLRVGNASSPFDLPSDQVGFANVCPAYSTWLANVAEDYDNPFHIKMQYRYRVPEDVMRRAGVLEECSKDAAIASIRIRGGRVFSPAVIVYPDFIAAIEGFDCLPFKEEEVEAVFQTAENLKMRSRSSWSWFTTEKR